jgi:signal recognition particle subunit SRP54
MFDALSERLGGIFDNLTGRGALSEKDVSEALREIRVALLEADVALPVVKDFIAKVKTRAVGEEVIRSVKPGQQVIKIVYDGLVDMLGGEDADTSLRVDSPPAVVMMAGLQGSGKTTTTGKLAKRLSEKGRKKVLLASLDVRRPAAMEQLAILADQCGENVRSLPIVQGQLPADIARRAMNAAKIGGYDVLFLDTAGRTSIDEQMMTEAAEIAEIAQPQETLLVADALTGQDAVETARRFHERLPLTGLVLTRMDGDGRGGQRSPCARSPACRSSSLVSAKSSTGSTLSMRSASRAASWGRGTSSRWSKKPPSRWTPRRPSGWRRRCARASSTSTIWLISCARCSRWAVLAA